MTSLHVARPHVARSAQRLIRAPKVLFAACLVCLVVCAPAAAADSFLADPSPSPSPEFVENAAGARDTLSLVDLGGNTAAIYTFIAADDELRRELTWQSAAGRFSFAATKFAAGDVNGDGKTDGIALNAISASQARFFVFLSREDKAEGGLAMTFKKRLAWTSPKGAFRIARATLAVGDVTGDGKDDVVVLYDRGKAGVELRLFISKGRTFRQVVAWRGGAGTFAAAGARLMAGDVTGDGRADAVVFDGGAPARLIVFKSKVTSFAKKAWWSGEYPADARPAIGDVDSDGDCDVVCLRTADAGSAALDTFLSVQDPDTKVRSFAAPATWWTSPGADLDASASRLTCGDLDADGRADAVVLSPTSSGGSVVATFASTGGVFEPGAFWSGDTAPQATSLSCGPAAPYLLRKAAVILSLESMAALTSVSPDAAIYEFAPATPQVAGLEQGDVMVLQPCDLLPCGAIRKVVSVAPQAGGTFVTTTQASVKDAVTQGEMAMSDLNRPEDMVEIVESDPGVELVRVPKSADAAARFHGLHRRAGVDFGFEIEFEATIKRQDGILGGAVTVKGALGFKEAISLTSSWGVTKWKWGIPIRWGMKKVRFTSTTTQTTMLRATVEARLRQEIEKDLLTSRFSTIVVWFGPVPVTLTPELRLYVGADGEVKAGVTTQVSTTTTITAGFEWRNPGGMSPIGDFDFEPEFKPPEIFGSAELRAYVGVEACLSIYGCGGPTAGLEGYAGLYADSRDDPWWKLAFGMDLKLGLKLRLFGGFALAELETSINLFEVPILYAKGKYKPHGSVNGHVYVKHTTTPITGAEVALVKDGKVVQTTESGTFGLYSFGDVTPGTEYQVVASALPDFAQCNPYWIEVKDGAATPKDVELPVFGGPGIIGTVRQGGSPVAGAAIRVYRNSDDEPRSPIAQTTTNGVGVYGLTLDGAGNELTPGAYTVEASKDGFFAHAIEVHVYDEPADLSDITLYALASQGVRGVVSEKAGGDRIAGAVVTLHEGYHDPDGPVVGTPTTSAADGSYSFSGVPAGYLAATDADYTVVATSGGRVRGIDEAVVAQGEWDDEANLLLTTTDDVSPARAWEPDDRLRWPAPLDGAAGTCEVGYRPTSTAPGIVAQLTFPTGEASGDVAAQAPVMSVDLTAEGVLSFSLLESTLSGPGTGTWHTITGTTELVVDEWYAIAVQYGPAGMRLYVDGHLEASDPTYTAGPHPVWADLPDTADGWFCLGDNAGGDGWSSAHGRFEHVRVSTVQRYWMDYLPATGLDDDAQTVVNETLHGTTTGGWNLGFDWVDPAPAVDIDVVTNGSDPPIIAVGAAVDWEYTVDNTGNVPLSGVVVDDDMLAPANDPTFTSGDVDHDGILDVDETWVYEAHGTAVAGTYATLGSVTARGGDDEVVSASDHAGYYGSQPGISMDVTTNGGDGVAIHIGDDVTWSYAVDNTGNVALGSVTVDDYELPAGSDPVYHSGDTDADGALDTSETWTFRASASAGPGDYSNEAMVSAVGPLNKWVEAEDFSSYFGSDPAVVADTKTNGRDGGYIYAGTPITWRTTVTNTGNGPLSGVAVDDSLLAPAADPAYVSGDADADDKLDTTETWIFEATGAAAIGPYANTASVTATGAASEPMSASDTSGYTGAKRPVVIQSEVCGQSGGQYYPAVSGQRVVWEDHRDPIQSDIYGWDFELPGEMVVNVPGSDQYAPAISGSRVVWTDRRTDVAGDIYGYDFAPPGTNFIVCDASDSQTDPAIGGDWVIWADHRGAAWDIYARDLSKPLDPEFVVAAAVSTDSSSPTDLAVSGTMAIWHAASGVYGCDLAVKPYAPFLITGNGIEPAISGDVVVFRRYADGTGWDIWAYSLGSATAFPICQANGDQEDPAVSGNVVVWVDRLGGSDPNIRGYEIDKGLEFPICEAAGSDQTEPAIDGGRVVWRDYRNEAIYGDIWGATLEF